MQRSDDIAQESPSGASGPWPSPNRAWFPPLWMALAGLVVFALVLADVMNSGMLRSFDHDVADRIRAVGLRDSTFGATTGYLFSQTGGRGSNVFWVLALCVAAFVGRRTLVPLLRIVVAVAVLYLAVYPFKGHFSRSFPMDPAGDYFDAVGKYGGAFPSGHQANAVLIASVGAWIAVDYIQKTWVRKLVCGYAMLAPIISAIAVLLMNYHWLSDVIAGSCVGIVLLWLLRTLSNTAPGKRLEAALTFAR